MGAVTRKTIHMLLFNIRRLNMFANAYIAT